MPVHTCVAECAWNVRGGAGGGGGGGGHPFFERVPQVEFMYLVFTIIAGELP